MRKIDVILKRAICLLTFADRCALEEKVTNGVRHSLNEREEQRKAILKWLNENDYYDYLTFNEKKAMETEVKKDINKEIYDQENDYECIEPLIWSVGLIDELHSYDEFVLSDLHMPLNIGRNHNFHELVKRCKIVKNDTLHMHREISMLWYWRCIECRYTSPKIMDYINAIKDVFGEEYIKLLEDYDCFDMNRGDFVVRGKTVAELSDLEIAKLEVIAERRFYAFEWLCSDEDWDNVDLIC